MPNNTNQSGNGGNGSGRSTAAPARPKFTKEQIGKMTWRDKLKNKVTLSSQDLSAMTWQQKLENNLPLSKMDEIKADADFNHNERVRQEEARQEFEARKNSGNYEGYTPSHAADENLLDDEDEEETE